MKQFMIAVLIVTCALGIVACGEEDDSSSPATKGPTPTVEEKAAATPTKVATPEPVPTLEATSVPVPTAEPTPTQSSKEDQLDKALADISRGWTEKKWALLWLYTEDDYKAKCNASEFGALLSFAFAWIGIPDEAVGTVEVVKTAENSVQLVLDYKLEGESLWQNEDDEPGELVYSDGRWHFPMSDEDRARENPCSIE